MPRKPSGRPHGRTLKAIDWEQVEWMMMAGASGIEIAGALDIHQDTLYDRFREEYGTVFSLASQNKKEGGKARLRETQLKQALKGNTALLIRLGEVILGQGQKVDISPRDDQLDKHLELAKTLGALEEFTQNRIEFEKWKAEKNAVKSEAIPEHLPSSEEIQHMGGSGSVGKDSCIDSQAD